MKNYIKIDGKKVEISDETANNFKKILKSRVGKGHDYYFINARAEADDHFECCDKNDEKLC